MARFLGRQPSQPRRARHYIDPSARRRGDPESESVGHRNAILSLGALVGPLVFSFCSFFYCLFLFNGNVQPSFAGKLDFWNWFLGSLPKQIQVLSPTVWKFLFFSALDLASLSSNKWMHTCSHLGLYVVTNPSSHVIFTMTSCAHCHTIIHMQSYRYNHTHTSIHITMQWCCTQVCDAFPWKVVQTNNVQVFALHTFVFIIRSCCWQNCLWMGGKQPTCTQ